MQVPYIVKPSTSSSGREFWDLDVMEKIPDRIEEKKSKFWRIKNDKIQCIKRLYSTVCMYIVYYHLTNIRIVGLCCWAHATTVTRTTI